MYNNTMAELKEAIQAQRFDECVAELSKDAQEYFALAVKTLSNAMGKGAGEKSAKALLYAIAIDGRYKNLRS